MLMRTILYWALVFLGLIVTIALAILIVHWSISARM